MRIYMYVQQDDYRLYAVLQAHRANYDIADVCVDIFVSERSHSVVSAAGAFLPVRSTWRPQVSGGAVGQRC